MCTSGSCFDDISLVDVAFSGLLSLLLTADRFFLHWLNCLDVLIIILHEFLYLFVLSVNVAILQGSDSFLILRLCL